MRIRLCECSRVALGVAALTLAAPPLDSFGAFPKGLSVYVGSNNPQQHALIAARYDIGFTGREASLEDDVVGISAAEEAFEWYVYNSLTDNYVSSPTGTPEHDLLTQTGAGLGIDPEEAYLHYFNDTVLMLQGQTVTVRGWGGGTAATRAEARVPVYYSNLTRRATHFSTPAARRLQTAVVLSMAFGTPFRNSAIHADGIMFDNAGTSLYNTGVILSGGQVLEAPGHPVIGTAQYQSWHWNSNVGPFLASLKDTLSTSAQWTPDHSQKKIAINISDTWNASIVTLDVADLLILEFQYSPVRNFGTDAVLVSYQRCLEASDAGIASYFSPHATTSIAGRPGSISYSEAMLGGFSWFLVARSPDSYFTFSGTGSLSDAGWDTLTWRPFVDVADGQLGDAVGPAFVLSQGTDPLGQAYKVAARTYTNGLALVRNRGSWDQGIEPASSITVTLPSPYRPVSASGTIGPPTSNVSLRNGQGMFFVSPTPVQTASDPVTIQAAFQVVATVPGALTSGIPDRCVIRWLLNAPVDSSLNAGSLVQVEGTASGVVAGEVTLDRAKTRLSFTPARPFLPGEIVRASLAAGLRTSDGRYLDGNKDGVADGDDGGFILIFTVAGDGQPRRPGSPNLDRGN
jgi:hypothetical protein